MNPLDIEKLQQMHPGIYERMLPHAQRAVSGFGAGRNVTEADINRMTNDVVRRSDFRRLPPGHTNRSLNDIARLLILANLYNNFGYNLDPFWLLYFGGIPTILLPARPPSRPPFRPGPGHLPHGRPASGRPSHGRPSHGGRRSR